MIDKNGDINEGVTQDYGWMIKMESCIWVSVINTSR